MLGLVVAVCPGLCRTDMVDPFRSSSKLSFSDRWTFYVTQLLFGRSASEAAADIVFLAAHLPDEKRCDFHGRFVQNRQVSVY
jgi:NAD(P)-dependent dehydrogenase (short-subunit alcohol dehydrogenase family)